VLTFPTAANGDVAPASSVSGDDTGLSQPKGVALDSSGNIYVTNIVNNSITVYPAGSTGNASPSATISGLSTGLVNPAGIVIDSTGRIYVTNSNNSVTVYAAGSTGNVAPAATITGLSTGLVTPIGITLDSASNIYVASSGNNSIVVFAAGSTGNATPTAVISGLSTGLATPSGIALDGSGDIYVTNAVSAPSASVLEFAAGSTGNVAPTSSISGSNTGLSVPFGIALDAADNIYVANSGVSGILGNSITVYAADSNGNVTPAAKIQGANTTLNAPLLIAIQ
jgi:sugar lactone lactonase YvrE